MFKTRKLTVIGLALTLIVFAASCKKKVPPPPPPPPPAAPPPAPPPPAAPTISQFTAEPSSIQRGQSSTLRWEVTGETTNVAVNQGIGTVQATGNTRVFPTSATTYTLTATGPGGTTMADATVAVAEPPPPPPPPPPAVRPKASLEQRLSEVQDAFYDYDKSDIRSDARETLTRDADLLKGILSDFPSNTIMVEGHCDERGSAEYNLGLGDRRATAAKDFLVQLGTPGDKLRTISYGKERPQCTESNESCWQRNRRAHFSPGQ